MSHTETDNHDEEHPGCEIDREAWREAMRPKKPAVDAGEETPQQRADRIAMENLSRGGRESGQFGGF